MTSAHNEDTQVQQLKDNPGDKEISPLMYVITQPEWLDNQWTCCVLCAQKSNVVDIKDWAEVSTYYLYKLGLLLSCQKVLLYESQWPYKICAVSNEIMSGTLGTFHNLKKCRDCVPGSCKKVPAFKQVT